MLFFYMVFMENENKQKDIDEYRDDEQDARQQVIEYIKRFHITRDAVDRYISYFPFKVYKSIYEMRLENILA